MKIYQNPTLAQKGFTLIELMVVIAIIAIIAAIAYPAYTESVFKSKRSDARIALTEAAARQEREYAQSGAYVTNADRDKLVSNSDGKSSPEGFYEITVSNTTSAAYLLTATAVGAQARDTACATFTLNHLGQKGSTGGGDCW